MENEDTLCCDTCGKTHWEAPIIEKPIRFAYRLNVIQLKQNTGDHRQQENICLSCLQTEINNLREQYKRSRP